MSKSETEPQFTTEGEKRFKGAYSKALADALRENENKGPSNSEDEVFDAYVALCYDDPIVPSNEACRALASALLPHEKNKKYALSNPLLQGLLQVTTSSRWNNNNNNKAATETSTMLTNNNATAPGYAELAYSVLCQGPLLCLQHNAQKDSMDIARAFLGTYAPHQKDTFTTRETTEKNVENFIQQMIDMNDTTTDDRNDNGSNNNSPSSTYDVVDNDEEDSLQEKFAKDSDPDDFDYGDDNLCHFPFQQQHPPQQEEAAFFFDPVTLSQPQVLLSPEEIQERFRCLLSELSYHRIECFDANRWKELGVSKTLVDLTLILLSEEDNSFLPPNKGELYAKPLFALRDRALNSSHQGAAMEDYIRLIHTLLSSSSNSSTSSFSRDMPLKLMVGFWSLSSLCASSPSEDLGTTTSQNKPQKNKIRECIFDNLDSLVDIMNQIYPPSSSLDGVRTMMNMLPILNFITSSSSKDRMVLSKEESRLLLQSGCFRELILASIRTTTYETSAPNEAIRQQLLRHILILSSQSPQILGKYATGVPHLIDEVLSGSSDNNDGLKKVDTILWFALVSSLNNDVSTTTVLLRKGQASKQQQPQLLSREKLCVECLNEFVLLCQRCTAEMRMWIKNRVTTTSDEKRSDGNNILDFMEFTNLVARLPYLAHAFVSALSHVEGGIHKSNDELNVMQHALLLLSSSLVKPSSMAESTMERKKSKDDERKKLKDIPRQNQGMGVLDENSLALVQKGVKDLTLLLDNNDAPSSITTHAALSSKTD